MLSCHFNRIFKVISTFTDSYTNGRGQKEKNTNVVL